MFLIADFITWQPAFFSSTDLEATFAYTTLLFTGSRLQVIIDLAVAIIVFAIAFFGFGLITLAFTVNTLEIFFALPFSFDITD